MNNKYWEEDIETMSREKLQELQLRRLKKTINIAANSPYYKKCSRNIISQLIAFKASKIFEKSHLPLKLICVPPTLLV